MEILVIIATTLSVILALIRIYDFYKEKNNIKVRVRGNYLLHEEGKPLKDEKNNTYMVISVINTGKEPVTITNAGLLSQKSKGYILFKDSVGNTKLLPADSKDYLMPENRLTKDMDRKRYIAFANTNIGKAYYSHNFLKRLIWLKRIK